MRSGNGISNILWFWHIGDFQQVLGLWTGEQVEAFLLYQWLSVFQTFLFVVLTLLGRKCKRYELS